MRIKGVLKSSVLRALTYLPYGITNKVIVATGTRSVRARRRLGKMGLFDESLRRLGLNAANDADEVLHTAVNRAMGWRISSLSRMRDRSFFSWCRIAGLDALGSRGESGVVLVNSHYGAGRAVPLAIARAGFEIYSLEPEDYLTAVGAQRPPHLHVISLREGSAFWLRQLAQAKAVLKKGGIVHIAVDGLQGKGGVERSFFGMKRVFQASFAQLAVQTGAKIVPVFATQHADGRVFIECEAALTTCDGTPSDARSQVEKLLDGYISVLTNRWRNAPAQILRKHLRYVAQGCAPIDQGSTMPVRYESIDGYESIRMEGVGRPVSETRSAVDMPSVRPGLESR